MSTKAMLLLAFHPPANLNNRRTMLALAADIRSRRRNTSDEDTLRALRDAEARVNGRLLTLNGRSA